jgi:hypothetical protein
MKNKKKGQTKIKAYTKNQARILLSKGKIKLRQ